MILLLLVQPQARGLLMVLRRLASGCHGSCCDDGSHHVGADADGMAVPPPTALPLFLFLPCELIGQ